MLTQYVHQQSHRGRAGKNTITVRPTGVIGLGKALLDEHSLQGRTDALLFYDAEKDLIAMKFLDEPQHGSVPLRQHNLHRSIGQAGFAKHNAIEPGEYHLLETTGNGLFVFARSEAHLQDDVRRIVVEVPCNVADDDVSAALALIAGKCM
jgi:hypothetical protein